MEGIHRCAMSRAEQYMNLAAEVRAKAEREDSPILKWEQLAETYVRLASPRPMTRFRTCSTARSRRRSGEETKNSAHPQRKWESRVTGRSTDVDARDKPAHDGTRRSAPSLHQRPDAGGRRAVFLHQPDQVADREAQLVAPVEELALVVDVDLVRILRGPVVRHQRHGVDGRSI